MAQSSSFTLPVLTPFDWESLLAFLRVRATPGVETVTDSAYQRTFGDQDQRQTLSVTYDHGNACLRVECSALANVASSGTIEARVRQIFKSDISTRPIEKFLGRS